MSVNPGPFGCYDTKVCIPIFLVENQLEPAHEMWFNHNFVFNVSI